MNFDMDEDQRSLQDTVKRLVAKEYSFEQRLAHAKRPEGWSTAVWASLAEIGLTALPISEEDGGLGGSAADMLITLEALGEAALLEPFLSSVVLCGSVLRHGASAETRAELLPGIADGSQRFALAHVEPDARHALFHVATTARAAGSGWVIEGRKALVLHGDTATGFLVSARVSGTTRERGGIALFHVQPQAAGIERKSFALLDGTRAADLVFTGVDARRVIDAHRTADALEHAWADAGAAACAEAVGTMDSLHRLTVDYLKTRRQFGRNIGSFQALQHRAVDMLIAVEQARSMVMFAAMSADAPVEERLRAVSAAKVQVCESSRYVSQQSIQLHGGIGMTLEYRAGHCVRRLLVLESLFGDKEFHLARLAAMGGLIH